MPHLLDGCWAKVERAEEHIQVLNNEIAGFLSSNPKPYEVGGEHRKNGRQYALTIRATKSVPLRFAVIAGEVVHHLRSSLDHILHALIVHNKGTPSRNNQFPLCATETGFEQACNSGLIKGTSRTAKKLIRSVQPYTSTAPDDTILYVVNEYDILDKHRLLIVVCAVAEMGDVVNVGVNQEVLDRLGAPTKEVAITGMGVPRLRRVTKKGTIFFTIDLAKPTPEFEAKNDPIVQIAFDKSGRAKLQPVGKILSAMAAGTRDTIKRFEGEFR